MINESRDCHTWVSLITSNQNVGLISTFSECSSLCKKKKKNRKKKHLEALQTHDVWFLRYGVQQAEFLVILGHFLPFYPTNNPQNQIFEKIIILHKCTKNLDHIIMFICYTVPEIWCVRCFFFFHFGLFFALLTSKQP